MILYGISNCNSVKKAKDWLSINKIKFEFHDFKKQGINPEKLKEWCSLFDWEKVLNKKGTTWRKLSKEEQVKIIDQESAVLFLASHTSAIKRPILEIGPDKTLLGFEETVYKELF
jgi:arsenate reductase